MLALTKDHYARETAGGRQVFRAGVAIEASQEELDAEARRRFPRLVPYVALTEDEVMDAEIASLASCDATADAMLRQLDAQRHREGFERSLGNIRVARGGIYGGDARVNEALERLTGGGSYAQA